MGLHSSFSRHNAEPELGDQHREGHLGLLYHSEQTTQQCCFPLFLYKYGHIHPLALLRRAMKVKDGRRKDNK